MKRFLTSFAALLFITVLSGNAMATAVISFTGASSDALTPTLLQQGSQVSYDLIGEGFPAVDAGDFELTFGTAGVLAFNSFVATNPPWDTSNLLLPPHSLVSGEAVMLVATSGASQVGDFTIGTFTFDVIGGPGSLTSLSLSDAFSGWTGPNNAFGNSVPVNYVDAHVQVQVVPVPAAMWLMLSAIGGLGFSRRLVL